MSVQPALKRQWVPIKGGSCDMRLGYGALESASKVVAGAVGKPKRSMVVCEPELGDGLRELLRRQMVDAGFTVAWHEVAAASRLTLAESMRLSEAFLAAGITSDDLCLAIGDADTLSLVSHAAGGWCGGLTVMAVPTDETALFEGVLSPRGLTCGDEPAMIGVVPSVRRVLFDYDLALSPLDSDAARYLRALMVSSAMAGTERDFASLWDRASQIMVDDVSALTTQLLATAKTRGQIMSSAAVAVRQSADYGQIFRRVVRRLTEGAIGEGELLGEGLRFAARLSVGMDKLGVDDMLAQDELLETLGIAPIVCDVDADELVVGIRRERLLRTNRMMLLVPLAIGRVRLTAVDDGLLEEHARAWCAAHRG